MMMKATTTRNERINKQSYSSTTSHALLYSSIDVDDDCCMLRVQVAKAWAAA